MSGIADLTPRPSGKPVRHYRTEALYDVIARWYDVAAPLMSLFIWGCPPLRYIDWSHRAVGRAMGGRLLVHPVGTGLLLKHVYSIHTQYPIVATDYSWRMLRQAQIRFEKAGMDNVVLVRSEPEHLPFAPDSFRAVMSMNGLNGFYDRAKAMAEMSRVLEPKGTVVGATLCRGLERTADLFLERYERWGIYPILRSRSYLVKELQEAFEGSRVRYETHGAVVFFLVDRSLPPVERPPS
ncbi:MAG: methyltransferase domain-containing protein [Bradymonadales bacterium]|nr:methyltransferase domain-containing protein [Bradymonadales bacterium]